MATSHPSQLPGMPPWMKYQYQTGGALTPTAFMSGPKLGMQPGGMGGMGGFGMGPGAPVPGATPSMGQREAVGFGQPEAGGMSGLEKAALIASVVGGVGQLGGSIWQGIQQDREAKVREEERQRAQRGREAGADILGPLLQQILQRQG